jgi:FtsH-binding integral membrane protein
MVALLLAAEAMVWGAYGPSMDQRFRDGVYVFHIAAASFYHYLTGYFFAQQTRPHRFTSFFGVAAINVAILAIASFASHAPALRFLSPIVGVECFTWWVALHLIASDLFPRFRT